MVIVELSRSVGGKIISVTLRKAALAFVFPELLFNTGSFPHCTGAHRVRPRHLLSKVKEK
jgi:hypothetical protein